MSQGPRQAQRMVGSRSVVDLESNLLPNQESSGFAGGLPPRVYPGEGHNGSHEPAGFVVY